MKKMRLLEYNGLHLDNQVALMHPWMMAAYPMVAFQHAHHSDVSPFKNTRTEANEEDLQMKLVKVEHDAATKGRLCYMAKANPEGKTMSPDSKSGKLVSSDNHSISASFLTHTRPFHIKVSNLLLCQHDTNIS